MAMWFVNLPMYILTNVVDKSQSTQDICNDIYMMALDVWAAWISLEEIKVQICDKMSMSLFSCCYEVRYCSNSFFFKTCSSNFWTFFGRHLIYRSDKQRFLKNVCMDGCTQIFTPYEYFQQIVRKKGIHALSPHISSKLKNALPKNFRIDSVIPSVYVNQFRFICQNKKYIPICSIKNYVEIN